MDRSVKRRMLLRGLVLRGLQAENQLLLALHCQALARLCGRGETHLFMRKYALFSLGRWPLGVRDGMLLLF